MRIFSTRQAARRLGINAGTLSRYIAGKKVPAPKTVQLGNLKVHAWSEKEIEKLRKLLPKIENGRTHPIQETDEEKHGVVNNKRAAPGERTPSVP